MMPDWSSGGGLERNNIQFNLPAHAGISGITLAAGSLIQSRISPPASGQYGTSLHLECFTGPGTLHVELFSSDTTSIGSWNIKPSETTVFLSHQVNLKTNANDLFWKLSEPAGTHYVLCNFRDLSIWQIQ